MLYRLVIFAAVFLCLQGTLYAQYWPGYITDNYSGINAAHVQPASIVSSPYKLDINFIGLEVNAVNTEVFGTIISVFNDDPLPFIKNTDEFLVAANIQLPSFMYRWNEKNAVGLDVKLRSSFSTEASDENIMDIFRQEYDDESKIGVDLTNAFITSRTNTWWDVSATYARKFIVAKKHDINAGLSVKYINGKAGGYLNVDNLSFLIADNYGALNDVSANVELVYNDDLDDLIENGDLIFSDNSTVGMSFGIEYKYLVQQAQYKFKVGLSIIDLGRMSYGRSVNSNSFKVNQDIFNLEVLSQISSLQELVDTLKVAIEGVTSVKEQKFSYSLPTKLGIQTDYHIWKNYYINFSAMLAVGGDSRRTDRLKNMSYYYLTPRIEKQKWGLSLPIFYNTLTGVSGGVSFRWGPIYIGMDNLFKGIFQEGNLTRLNAFFGIKFTKLGDFSPSSIVSKSQY